MNCIECDQPAIAVCSHCGAAVCREHAVEREHVMHVFLPIQQPVPIAPPARRIFCTVCDPAVAKQTTHPHPDED